MFGLFVALTKRRHAPVNHRSYICEEKHVLRVQRYASALSFCVIWECKRCGHRVKLPRETVRHMLLGHW